MWGFILSFVISGIFISLIFDENSLDQIKWEKNDVFISDHIKIDSEENLFTTKVEIYKKDEISPGDIYTTYLFTTLKDEILSDNWVNKSLENAIILSNTGEVKKYPKKALKRVVDFKRLKDGSFVYYAYKWMDRSAKNWEWRLFDKNYDFTHSVSMKNYDVTDSHDFLLLENGNYLMMAYVPQEVSISSGQHLVKTLIIQEQDISWNIVFEWNAFDYYDFDESLLSTKNLDKFKKGWIIDYFHGNSLFEDFDGNIIVLLRSLSQSVKIDRITWEIIWKLGWLWSDFMFVNDPLNGPSRPHHTQRISNWNILLYDNGNDHDIQQTRMVEYKLNMENMTAELVWTYARDWIFTKAKGSVQRLENWNTFIWWWIPDKEGLVISEVNSKWENVMDIYFPKEASIYRAYKLQ